MKAVQKEYSPAPVVGITKNITKNRWDDDDLHKATGEAIAGKEIEMKLYQLEAMAEEILERGQEEVGGIDMYDDAQHHWTCEACGEKHAIHRVEGVDLIFVNSDTGDGWYYCPDLNYGKCDCGKPVRFWDKDGNLHND
jgi:hypothetical protein